MKELLNLEGYGLSLVFHKDEDEPYEVVDGIDEPYNCDHYGYDNRSEAVSHIVTEILNPTRIYDPESVPDDLRRVYNAIKEMHTGVPRQVAYTFLFYALDDIAATNEYAERRK